MRAQSLSERLILTNSTMPSLSHAPGDTVEVRERVLSGIGRQERKCVVAGRTVCVCQVLELARKARDELLQVSHVTTSPTIR